MKNLKELPADLAQVHSVQLCRFSTWLQSYHTQYMILIRAHDFLCTKLHAVGLRFLLRSFKAFICLTLVLPAKSLVSRVRTFRRSQVVLSFGLKIKLTNINFALGYEVDALWIIHLTYSLEWACVK
jgi:hypothetical protein